MRIKSLKMLYIFIIITLMFTMTISCTSNEDKEKEKSKDEIPLELESINKYNETIIETIEKSEEDKEENSQANGDPEEVKKAQKEQEKEDEESKKEEESSGGDEGKEKNKDEASKEEQTEGAEENLHQKTKKIFSEISTKVNEIHKEWNNYEITSVQDGTNDKDIDNFKEAINKMTIAIDNKDIQQILIDSNETTLALAVFYDLYKGNIDGDKNRIRYFVRKTYLDAKQDKWEDTNKNIDEALLVFEKFQNKIEADTKNQEQIDKLKLSIKDMQAVLEDKNVELLKVKRDIVLDNLDTIIQIEKE